jgi:hypothetical protein
MSFFHLYLRNGIVYLPTVARTDAGFYMDVEPVRVVKFDDRKGLQSAIVEAMSRGNSVIPAPTRAAFPKAVVLKHANVKSWAAFEKNALVWSIDESNGNYRINPGRRRADRGWEDDPERIESFAPGTTLDAVAQRLLSLIEIAAAGGAGSLQWDRAIRVSTRQQRRPH